MRCSTVLALLVATSLATAAVSFAADLPPRTIVVAGNGEASATPDIADLSFAIETHAATAADASSRNAALAQKVVDALKAKLGDKGRVWTGGYSLSPDYDQRPGRDKPAIVGYNAQNSITVETGELSLLGPMIDAAIAAGANRVNYLNMSLKDDTKTRSNAIAAASRDAQAQAQALAASLGVKLKRVMTASTESQSPGPIPLAKNRMEAMSAMGTVATPVEAGQVTVPATVSLTYEIE